MRCARVVSTLVIAAAALGWGCAAEAQAWLPYPGAGTLSASYAFFNGNDHLFSTDAIDGQTHRGYTADGNRWFLGDTTAHTLAVFTDVGLHRRVAVSIGLAYVSSRYEGLAPVSLDLDDGDFHGSLQDGRIELRTLLVERPFLLTPFAAWAFPTRRYIVPGHSAAGRRLNELHVGTYLGRSLAPSLGNAYVHGTVAFAVAEKIDGIRIGRSLVDVELGYFVTSALSLRANALHENTYGGVDWVSGDPENPVVHEGNFTTFHAQIAAARAMRIGFGAGYQLFSRVDVSASYITTVWGENTDDANFAIVGMSYRFTTPWARADGGR